MSGPQFGLGSLPDVSGTDEVQFFYLESSFPFTAPPSLVTAAGSQFNSFVTTHCGLGVFDVTTNVRFSIELVALNYTGSLFPDVTAAGGFAWNNAAALAVTNPFQPANWLISRLVSTTSGTAFTALVAYLQKNWGAGLQYNPVTVALSSAGSSGVAVAPADSYSFVQSVLEQLGSFGAPLDSFLSPSATAFTYFAAAKPSEVVWPGTAVPTAVRRYYSSLELCYRQAYASAGDGPGADTAFLLALQKQCYKPGGSALVYRSATSVWNVTVAASSANTLTPSLVRAAYSLPATPGPDTQHLSATDSLFLLALIALAVCGLGGILKQTVCVRKSRFHLEQERMADETVDSILKGDGGGGGGDGGGGYPHFSAIENELREYFYPRSYRWEQWYPQNWSWWSRAGSASGSGSGSGSGSASGGASDWRDTYSTKQLAQRFSLQQQQYQQEQQHQQRRRLQQQQRRGSGSGNPFDSADDDYSYSQLPGRPSASSASNVVHV